MEQKLDEIGVSMFARIVGLSRPTIYGYIKSGLITPIRHERTKGGRTRYVLSKSEALAIKAELTEGA